MIGPRSTPDGFHDALLEDDPVQLYERAPCGYLSTTPDGLIVKVNETFLAWTGLAHGDLVGRRTFAELLTAGGRIYHETHYAPMLSMHGSVREIALEIVKSDGGRLPVLVNSVLERDAGGTPTVVRVAVFDASDRREYERELLRAKERAEESEARARALAMTLQRTLIPPEPPEVNGLDVAGVYRPAGTGEEVGGDFYDIFQIGLDDWVVVLGDVCGKGADAAVVTALVRYTLRAVTVQERGASTALRALNDVLLRHRSERFCTVVLLRARREDGAWVVSLSWLDTPFPCCSGRVGRRSRWASRDRCSACSRRSRSTTPRSGWSPAARCCSTRTGSPKVVGARCSTSRIGCCAWPATTRATRRP